MASRGGPRALGTDGLDFTHREKIASHYRLSALYKSRLKTVGVVHAVLWLLMLFRLMVPILRYFAITPPLFLLRMGFPRAFAWEMLWLPSVTCNLFALLATRRNKPSFLYQYVVGSVVFGFIPLGLAAYTHFEEFQGFVESRTASLYIVGYPAALVWLIFLALASQVHLFGLYFAAKLINSWSARTAKKKA